MDLRVIRNNASAILALCAACVVAPADLAAEARAVELAKVGQQQQRGGDAQTDEAPGPDGDAIDWESGWVYYIDPWWDGGADAFVSAPAADRAQARADQERGAFVGTVVGFRTRRDDAGAIVRQLRVQREDGGTELVTVEDADDVTGTLERGDRVRVVGVRSDGAVVAERLERLDDAAQAEGQQQGAAAEAREVRVQAREFTFYPSHIAARPGQPLRIVLENTGRQEHSIVVELPDGDVGLDRSVAPGESAVLELRAPEQPGTYTFYCPIDRHRDMGMVGDIAVQAQGQGGAEEDVARGD